MVSLCGELTVGRRLAKKSCIGKTLTECDVYMVRVLHNDISNARVRHAQSHEDACEGLLPHRAVQNLTEG